MPSWPSILPQHLLEQGFSEALADRVIETPVEAGQAKRRPRYTVNNRMFTGSVAMTLQEREAFEDWFENDLMGGALPFDWVHPIYRTPAAFRFRKPVPKFTVRGDAHIVVLGLEEQPTYKGNANGYGAAAGVGVRLIAAVGNAAGVGDATTPQIGSGTAAGAGTATGASIAVARMTGRASGTSNGSLQWGGITGGTDGKSNG